MVVNGVGYRGERHLSGLRSRSGDWTLWRGRGSGRGSETRTLRELLLNSSDEPRTRELPLMSPPPPQPPPPRGPPPPPLRPQPYLRFTPTKLRCRRRCTPSRFRRHRRLCRRHSCGKWSPTPGLGLADIVRRVIQCILNSRSLSSTASYEAHVPYFRSLFLSIIHLSSMSLSACFDVVRNFCLGLPVGHAGTPKTRPTRCIQVQVLTRSDGPGDAPRPRSRGCGGGGGVAPHGR